MTDHALLENQYYETAHYANIRQRMKEHPSRCMKCGINMATDIHIARTGVIGLCRACHRIENDKLTLQEAL